MSRKDAGNYKAKHPPERMIDQKIADAIKSKRINGEITCHQAAAIAEELHVPMAAVGATLDLVNVRITECQMGFFGYRPVKKIVAPSETFDRALDKALHQELVNGCLPCVKAWKIADEFKLSRMRVSSVCEALKIKIKPCQLGAF